MNATNKKIDDYFKRQRKETIAVVLCILTVLALFSVLFTSPNMGEVTEVKGTVINLTGVPTEEGDRLYILVRLENENINPVRVFIPRVTFYKKGKVVSLYKIEPLYFGRTAYKFKKYI